MHPQFMENWVWKTKYVKSKSIFGHLRRDRFLTQRTISIISGPNSLLQVIDESLDDIIHAVIFEKLSLNREFSLS